MLFRSLSPLAGRGCRAPKARGGREGRLLASSALSRLVLAFAPHEPPSPAGGRGETRLLDALCKQNSAPFFFHLSPLGRGEEKLTRDFLITDI